MPDALERKSTLAIKTESSYGVDPTVAAADVLEFVSPFTMEPTRGEIERNVIRNTFSELESVLGDEEVAGDVNIELHGSGTAGTAPESDPLWEAGVGVKNTSTASTTTTGSTTTSLELTGGGGSNFAVGDAILIDPLGGSAYEVVWITAIATDTLTVSPALSSAPGTGIDVGAGVHYKLTKSDPKSLWMEFWRGDIVKETFKGCLVNNVALNFNVGETINPVFSLDGKETAAPATESYSLGTPSYDDQPVHVARYMAVKIDGTTYPVSNIALAIAKTLSRQKDVTTAGTNKILRVKRMVTGSFNLRYENKDVEDAFRAGSKAELIVVSSEGGPNLAAGNTFGFRCPKIRYTSVPKETQDGIFRYNVSFKAILTDGEDELSSLSFL